MKKTKKIKYIITYIICGLMFACDSYIDVVPDNLPTIDIAFNSRINAERFFYTLYGYMPQHGSVSQNPAFFGGDELWTTDRTGEGFPAFAANAQGFQSVSNPSNNYWSSYQMFIALRDCNIFLENIDRPRDIEEFERARWIAEAKFLKAYYHFWLLRMYGPIPTVKDNIDISLGTDNVRVERDKVDDTVDYIVSLLDEAIVDLPPSITNILEELGRATKPMAASVKAKVLAMAASPLFNGNQAYANWVNDAGEPYINQTFDITKWEKAAVASEQAVTLALQGSHSLYEANGTTITGIQLSDSTKTKLSIRGAISDRWNSEIIWGSLSPTGDNYQQHAYPVGKPGLAAEVLPHPDYAPTLRMAELYYSDNGVPIAEDVTYDYANRYEPRVGDADHKYYIQPGYTTVGLHFNREPRFHAGLAFDGGIVYGQGILDDKLSYTIEAKKEQTAGASHDWRYSITGYVPKKMSGINDAADVSFVRDPYPWPVIRLADMYLLHAECSNEAYGPSTEVYNSIDIVRERAGLDGVLASWSASSINPSKPTTKEGLRDIIHQERLIELAFEGHRFWDLRRWLKAPDYLSNSDIKGWDVQEETVEGYYTLTKVGKTQFGQKDYFWPIPEDDIFQNPNLDQAPGW